LAIAFQHYATMTDAVRAGARVAAVTGSQASATTATVNASDGLLAPPDVDVAYSGTDVTVTAQHDQQLALFGVPVTTIHLQSTTTERVEQ
jgi:hypothetical protein